MSTSESIENQLRRSALGLNLADSHVQALADLATPEVADAGTVLFKEGAEADRLSVVSSGSVALDMYVPRRGAIRILTLGAGDMLGWSALVSDGSMSATATVLEDTSLLNFDADPLRQLCTDDTDLGYAVLDLVARALARRLHGTRLQMLDLFSETEPTVSQSVGSSPE